MTVEDDFSGDEVGPWSEIKLDIVRDYAAAYSRVLSAQSGMSHAYIDGFAGAGEHRSRTTGELIPGSPRIALQVEPPFADYYFIDLLQERADLLEELKRGRSNVHVFQGDCNEILLRDVFPAVRYESYRRALCLLDPYGMNLRWETIAEAGAMRSVEVIVNLPLGAINRNALLTRAERIDPEKAARMNAVWGDDSWRADAYTPVATLFGDELEKNSNEAIAEAFRRRLETVAGFTYVPKPLPMRNSNGVLLYYIYFASPSRTGARIIEDIFRKWRKRGIR